MKRIFLPFIFLLVVALASANAQLSPLTGAGGKFKAGASAPPSYTGPGDIVSGATFWGGLRCYANAHAGGNAIRIRRASDNTEQNVALTANCDLTDVSSTFCAATTCFVTTLYDQSGNGNDAVQTTNSNQPQLAFSCIGSLPCITFDGVTPQYLKNTGTSISDPFSTSAVGFRNIAGRGAQNILWCADVSAIVGFHSDDTTFISNEELTASAADNAWHSLQQLKYAPATTDMTLNVDDIRTTGPTGFGTSVTGFNLGLFVDDMSSPLNGKMTEFGVWFGVSFTSGNLTNLCHNAYTYWGTSTSC